ncbi:MAG: DUF308 domain-containing protein [Methanobacteriaceae archaeon]|jgi:uncharacterized membrane protein HdeD (DUF308 family)|nr:DUF308 domain-containing protein [Methanobacteriaceae archaeon]
MENQKIFGIIAIILGILVIVFPMASDLVLSVFAGIMFAFLGIYYLLAGAYSWNFSKGVSISYIILGILGIILGCMLSFNILLFSMLIGIYMYITGFMLLISGIIGLAYRTDSITKMGAGSMLILGILTIIIGFFAFRDPFYAALLIGLSLIIDGISLFFGGE